MEVELKLEPGRQEPKVVILAGEDSPSLERLRAHLSGLSLGPITVWRGERALPVRQEEFLRFFADGKGVSAQTAEQTYPVRLRLYELEERLDTCLLYTSPLHHSTHLFQKLEYNGAHQVRTGPLGPYT